MRRRGFTLVEVLIALALSAALFAAALNLLLGVVTAWERARAGDLEADADYRLFAFLREGLSGGAGENAGEAVEVAPLPGERSDYFLNFPLRASPLVEDLVREWRTERFALVADRREVLLVPVVEDEERDRPSRDEGLALYGDDVEVTYWSWDEIRERWEELDELETEGGAEPDVPGYVLLKFPDGPIRWIRVGTGEGDSGLW